LDSIVSSIGEWRGKKIKVEKIGGLTNENYLLTVNNERFVLRICRQNARDLQNDRNAELESLKAASNAGIAPEVFRFFLPEGHMITRYIAGRHWTGEEYFDDNNRSRLVSVVKKVHSLPGSKALFSPFEKIAVFSNAAKRLKCAFPGDYAALLDYQEDIRKAQGQDKSDWLKLCHNDLYYVNFVDDRRIWLLDWEFSGMGDIYFDLAILTYAYESYGVLPFEKQERTLRDYFGEVTAFHWLRFDGMRFMLMHFNALWALIQDGHVRAGHIPAVKGFDYREYAENSFREMHVIMCETSEEKKRNRR